MVDDVMGFGFGREQRRLEHRQCAMAQRQGYSLNLASAGTGNTAAFAVRANFFALKYPKDVALYDYPVVIAPDVVSAAVRKRVFELLESTHRRCTVPPRDSARLGRRSWRREATFLQASLRQAQKDLKGFTQSRSSSPRNLGLQTWIATCKDVNYIPLPIISAFNLITTAHALHTSHGRVLRPERAPQRCASNPQSFYRRVRVTTKHLGYRRKNRIKAFGSQLARKTVFQGNELGGMVSVEQYFQRKFNIRLQLADNLPVINVGNKVKDNFVPAEFCEIEPGQPFAGILSGSEAAGMTKYSINPPYIDAKAITEQGIEVLGLRRPYRASASDSRSTWRLSLHTYSAHPKVIYSSGTLSVANGSWNARDVHFHRHEVPMDSSDPALRGVVIRFLAMCQAGRMHRDCTKIMSATRANRSSLSCEIWLFDALLHGNGKCKDREELKRRHSRACKYWLYVAIELRTLVFKAITLLQHSCGRMSNVGTLLDEHGVVIKIIWTNTIKARCLEHSDHKENSFICFYPASLGLQEHEKEASDVFDFFILVQQYFLKQKITRVKQIMIERLNEYLKHMKTLPERVVVFRGGVSDDQFKHVLIHALPEIKAAFRSFKGYNLKLTIVICGKRLRTRFYPTRLKQADKTSNMKAGMLVDRGVTAVQNFDFFLQAHAGQRGTQGAHDASYLQAPATKGVRLVPPAYAAERARQRARLYLHEILPPPPDSRESAMDEAQILRRANEAYTGVHENLRSSMFYFSTLFLNHLRLRLLNLIWVDLVLRFHPYGFPVSSEFDQ
ncbi:Piwi domain-containing protein [Phellopilus nigrolimitatus]|nr:Piwi domain-containing protein [Phellopilus nigrolimitatus]